MVVAVWSVKGGVGVTSVAGLLAIGQAERAEETVLVDLCGDVPLVLGCDDQPVSPGISEWAALENPSAQALDRIKINARISLDYVPLGAEPLANLEPLVPTLRGGAMAIVDCGVVVDPSSPIGQVVANADQSILVARECFLTLRAVQNSAIESTGVIVIKEDHRFLGRPDVEAAARAPVLAEIAADRTITSALDAGLARATLPRRLIRSMGKVVQHVA